MHKHTVLIVEDEIKILKTLTDYLVMNNYNVIVAEDGFKGMQKFREFRSEIDLVLLDIMLPFADGNEILKEVRKSSNTPVIMLSAKSSVENQLQSFSYGADDYIAKPYALSLVKAHMEAILKRSCNESEFLCDGVIRIDKRGKKVYFKERYIEMTPKEFEVLQFLLQNKGQVLTRDIIIENIWGYDYIGETRTVDTVVKQLRKKLDGVSCIRTIYGIGYIFEGNEDA